MCFHYSLTKEALKRENIYDSNLDFENLTQYHVNGFNYPKMPVMSNEDGGKLKLMQWGLIPKWVKDTKQADEIKAQTLNARSETAFDKPSFKSSMGSKHCLVFASGFFEWMNLGKQKYPHYIFLKNYELMAFGGIWESWTNKETGEVKETFSILTTHANPLMAKIHNTKLRMPVIVPKDRWMEWLKLGLTKETINSFFTPYPESGMEAYTISKLITSKKESSNQEKVLQKVEYPELGLFLGLEM